MNTAIINSDSYERHDTGNGHPEQPKRVIAISPVNIEIYTCNSFIFIFGN